MKILVFFLIQLKFVIAQDPSEAGYEITELPDPNPSYISLMSSHSYPCSEEETLRKCERNLIYEKDTEQLFQMITDGRNLESGELDVNEVLRNPSSYGGEIKTIELKGLFPKVKKFESVIAHYTKEGKIYIEVKDSKNKYSETIDIP